MKLIFVVIFLLVVVQRSDQSTARVRRTRGIFNTISQTASESLAKVKNKIYQTYETVKSKGRSIRDFVFNTPKKVGDKLTNMKNKLLSIINQAEITSSTIYDNIAPARIDNECSSVLNDLPPQQLIDLHGYASELHTVITDDKYILTVHRIPYPRESETKQISRKTVLLHHGLLGSSADWIIPGPGKGLAYILADAGYDVWMANVRGNTYSRAHLSRKLDSYAFWNFTFHEVAQYDLPAVINYITDKKGENIKINYVGYSMGTTALFALLSTKPEYNQILNAGFAIAPIAYMSMIKSPFVLLARRGDSIESLLNLVGAHEFLPRNAVARYLSKHSCQISYLEEPICELSMFTLCGHSQEFDTSLKPIILGHVPAGTSTKTLAHYAQLIRNGGQFQQYSYGTKGNLERYGTADPPTYPLHNITLPIALLSGDDDWLSSIVDAMKLYAQLRNPIEHYIVPLKEFNHVDFMFARDARMLVYDKLLQMLENSYTTNDVDNHI